MEGGRGLVVDSQDVQAAFDQLAQLINQSVLVEDRAQKPVWWSTHGAVDDARSRTVLYRTVDAAAAVVGRFHLRTATTPVRTPAIPEAGMWARWCVPVRHQGRFLGLVWVLDPDGTVTDTPEAADEPGRRLPAATPHVHRTHDLHGHLTNGQTRHC